MTSLLQIRNVSEEARRALKARAAARGESLNSYLLEIIEREVERPTAADVLARAAARSEKLGTSSLDVLEGGRVDREGHLQAQARA